GKATCIAPLQPSTLAAIKPWGIPREHAVQDFPVFCAAKVIHFIDSDKYLLDFFFRYDFIARELYLYIKKA
ncbi:MAG: hypothetical protein II206_09080, partial [Bacteroidaceae bacterium]|nr:hypothetical protein [Bacteroidaceae bacterium]